MKQKFIAVFTSRWARIGLPIITLLVGIVFTLCTAKIQKSTYTASTRVWIPSKMFVAFNREADAVSGGDSALTTGPNALKTACEIMHSDAVTKLAYESLKAKLGDKCPSADTIQGGLRARQVESTDILELSFTGTDPDLTVAILQSALDGFMSENNLQLSGPLQKSKIRLEQQLKVARAEYSKVKNKVKSFQDQTNFIDMQADVSSLSLQKQDLEKALDESTRELKSLKGRLDYSQKQLGFGPESVVAVQKLSDDEIMRSLRQHIAETEVALIGLRSKYQDEHPKVKRLKASLAEAKKGIDERYLAIVGKPGLKDAYISGGAPLMTGGSTGASGGNGVGGGISENAQARMISEMAESSTNIASLEAKVASLTGSLGQVRAKLASVPAKQLELADIRRADELATNSLTSIERELQRVHLNESVEMNGSNMQIIDEPEISSSSTPNIWMSGIACSLISSVLVAVAQFFMAPKIINVARLSSLIALRTVGFVPQVEGARSKSSSPLLASIDRIRLSLEDWFHDGSSKPIIVTSGSKDDGKSTIAYALADSLTNSGKNVLIIDADTRFPSIHRLAGISGSPGLLQYIEDPEFDSLQIMHAVRPNLTVIPAGGVYDAANCIMKPRFARLISEFSNHFDAIIIDSPDCGDSLDSLVTPSFNCRWLAVVRLGKTLIHSVQNLGTQLELIPSMESVMVVNGVKQKDVAQLRETSVQFSSTQPANVTANGSQAQSDRLSPVDSETAAW